MSIQEFEELVLKHSLSERLMYNTNALAGEVGEVCNVVKKIAMAAMKPEWLNRSMNSLTPVEEQHEKLDDELGDALFYLIATALRNGTDMQRLFTLQAKKLELQSEQYGHTFLK